MKKYFLNDGTGQQGPFDLEELKSKSITAETPVWYEGLPEWTTAGKLDELKELFVIVPPPFTAAVPVVEEVQPVIPVEELVPVSPVSPDPIVITDITPSPVTEVAAPVASTTATVTATAPAAAAARPAAIAAAGAGKKGSKAVSWIATLLILGGAGFFVYQDIDKNGGGSSMTAQVSTTESGKTGTTTEVTATTPAGTDQTTTDNKGDTAVTTTTTMTTDVPPINDNTTKTTTTTTTTNNNAQQVAAQKAAAAKKAEDDKKKQLAMKKAEDDKKRIEAAKAATAARELEMRTHWSKYITFGNLNYETKGDGIKPFDVPVYNGTDAILDKVTVRIEYVKKNEKKIFKTETITIYNVPPHGGLNGKAPESKKGEKVNVFFTAITSSKLHFCYPQNNGSSDPYFCN